jgi:prepilin-type N-terminal cleavage/methylation domain-containing protein
MGKGGFTLLEMLLAIGIIMILATASFGIYTSFVSSVQFNAAREDVISDLKTTREAAMSGEYGENWGIQYTNLSSSSTIRNPYYYTIFYTPANNFSSASTVTTTVVYLPSGVVFSNPSGVAASSTIIFTDTTGTTTSSASNFQVSIGDNSNDSSTVTITPSGTIY